MGVISTRLTLHDFTDMLPHPIAECIGSVNASDLLAAVMPSLKDPVCATAYVSLLTWKGEVSSALVSVAGEVLTDKVFEAICAPFVDVIPCLESVLLQTVMPLVTSQPCCSSVLSDVVRNFGAPLDVIVSNATRLVADVVCSTQSPGFYNQSSQTCAFTLLESFLAPTRKDPSVLFSNTLNAMQVPNDQGVAAMSGKMFKGTLNITKPALFTAPFLPGSCVRPANSLLTWVRSFPILQESTYGLPLSQLFNDNSCLPGGPLMSIFTSGDSPAMLGMKAMVRNNASCFHLANGYPTDGFDAPALTLFTSTLHEIALAKNPATTTPPTSTPPSSFKQEFNAAFQILPSWLVVASTTAIICSVIKL
ncbi:hypothetical protein DYB28_009795 [Aphanomyces astaci]|uniref:Uncharacterized protein n=1 Tax=Aphanomyces astaci TaxID=112090 RepID=A0A3L6VCS8_APHAT|nr:hypothetical protein AaE_013331 [Aphanomyces astaci]RLO06685.1 hypothetical protein DYB28_009795 [Aphanomyces astaci]